jgi:hypothetical protein
LAAVIIAAVCLELADNPQPDTNGQVCRQTRPTEPPRLRFNPFGKGMLAGMLISLAAWAFLAHVVSEFF